MMYLNCDLGEGFDEVDQALIPLIDQVNIACGGHAGTPESMMRCVLLAQKYKTQIGAHPSYPDTKNFGRFSLDISLQNLKSSIKQQMFELQSCCQQLGQSLVYVKPHGALYHDVSSNVLLFDMLLDCLLEFKNKYPILPLSLMVAANLPSEQVLLAQKKTIPLIFEGFADRAYQNDGSLVSRSQPYAVLDSEILVLKQVRQLIDAGGVYSVEGVWVPLRITSICVHGDTPSAVNLVKAIRAYL
jgi:UPF0271 protein